MSKRIFKELKEFKTFIDSESIDNHRLISLTSINDDKMQYNICFLGPKDSPYEENIHNIYIDFPPEYPHKPPHLKFTSIVHHPNISIDGLICLDILKDKWCPIYTIRTIILSIISLLSDPNPDSPLNGKVAELYKKSLVDKTAKREYYKLIMNY